MSIGMTNVGGLATVTGLVTFRAERSAAAIRSDEIAREFQSEVKKDPIERLRETILKRHGLSQAQFDSLPAEKKASILREIDEAIRRATKGVESGTSEPGSNVSVLI